MAQEIKWQDIKVGDVIRLDCWNFSSARKVVSISPEMNLLRLEEYGSYTLKRDRGPFGWILEGKADSMKSGFAKWLTR